MTLPPLPITNSTLHVSATQLALMRTCMRKWAFRDVFKREPDGLCVARDAGAAFHSALQAGHGATRVEERIERSIPALAKAYEGLEMPPDEHRHEARMREVLEGYWKHWGEEPFETLAVEKEFKEEMGVVLYGGQEVRVVLRGLMDRVVRWKENGRVEVGDTKTKGEWKASYQDHYERSLQMRLYGWVLSRARVREEEWAGKVGEPLGYLIDVVVIRKPHSEATMAKAAKSESYMAKLLPRTEYHRLRYDLPLWQAEASRLNALETVQRAISEYEDGLMSWNEEACAHEYGRRCGYWDVCGRKEEEWGMVLGSDFFRDKREKVFGKEEEE